MNIAFYVTRVRLFSIVFISLVLFFTGCAMKNVTVVEDKRISFSAETEALGVYRSGPLTVTYEYQSTGETLTISGDVEFRQSVDSLDVRLAFLDATGLVINKKIVYSSGFRSLASRDSTRTFRRSLEIPVGAVGFSFMESSVARTSRR